MQLRHTPKSIVHALFTASVLVIAVITLTTLSRDPNLQSLQAGITLPSSDIITFTATPDKTALQQLQAKADVELKITSSDADVVAVNQRRNGADDKYWRLYVNGRPTNQNPATLTTNGGETIQWRYE